MPSFNGILCQDDVISIKKGFLIGLVKCLYINDSETSVENMIVSIASGIYEILQVVFSIDCKLCRDCGDFFSNF